MSEAVNPNVTPISFFSFDCDVPLPVTLEISLTILLINELLMTLSIKISLFLLNIFP